MSADQVALLAAAGFAAGAVNAAVGSGTLITFPTLLALGVPPVSANATNSMGLFPGNVAGVVAYRDRLPEFGPELRRWSVIIGVSAVAGAGLVLALPSSVFAAAVPWLILIAVALVALQPLLVRHFHPSRIGDLGATSALVAAGFYGGYFGAGQGIAYLVALGVQGVESLHSANAAKNLFAAVANACAAVLFALAGQVDWAAAFVLAASSMIGGYLGGRVTRRLPAPVLRGLVIVVGLVAAAAAMVG